MIHEIEQMNQYNRILNLYVKELQNRAGDKGLANLAEFRNFPLETIKELGIFYIGDAVEMLIPTYLKYVDELGVISPTNKKPIFHDRFIIPIKDIHGNILTLVGYNKEAQERYIYGTSRYYRRRDTLYGLEKLETAYKLGYAIVTEGITDTIMLRSLGYEPVFAMCGTHSSDFIIRQLNRCRYGVIKVPDRDEAGLRASKKWDFNRSITLNTFIKYKDIDSLCRESDENKEWAKEYINICIDWILQGEHKGYKTSNQILTMS